MKLLKLTLKNFKGWSELSLDLSTYNGITLIQAGMNGDVSRSNGVGKSSIVSAISLAIIGRHVTKSMDSFIKHSEDSFYVSLDFEYNGVEYTIRRTKKRGVTQKKVFKEIKSGKKLTIEPYELFDISPDIWNNTIYSAQNNLAGFIAATPANRKDILIKLFNLSKYTELEKSAKKIYSELNKDYLKLSGERAQLLSTISGIDIENEKILLKKLKQLKSNLNEIENDLTVKSAKRLMLSNKLLEFNHIAREISDINARLNSLSADIAKANADYNISINDLEKKLAQASAFDIDFLTKELSEAKTELTKYDSTSKNLTVATDMKLEMSNKLASKKTLLISLEGFINKTRNDFESSVFSKDNCPTCGAPIDADTRAQLVNSFNATLNEAEAERSSATSAKDKLTADIAEVDSIIKKLNDDFLRIESIKLKMTSINNALFKATELKKLNKNYEKIKNDLFNSHAEFIKMCTSEQGERKQRLTELVSKNKDKENIEKELTTIVDELAALEKIKLVSQDEYMDVKDRHSKLIALKEELDKLNKILQDKQLKLKSTKLEADAYAMVASAFGADGIPILIMEGYLAELQTYVDEYMLILSDGKISVKFRTTRKVELKTYETLEIDVNDSEGTRILESYSGGEKVRIYLAIRLALAKFISHRIKTNLNIFIIDEIAELDDVGLSNFVTLLNTISSDFSQIFLVSHLAELKSKFNNILMLNKDIFGKLIGVN